jgi:hypothetical protein
MWNDIDLYHAFRDFTTDPVSFPIDDVKALIDNLVRIKSISSEFDGVHWAYLFRRPITSIVGEAASNVICSNIIPDIPIVDAAVAKQVNATDIVRHSLAVIYFHWYVDESIVQYDPYTRGAELWVAIMSATLQELNSMFLIETLSLRILTALST